MAPPPRRPGIPPPPVPPPRRCAVAQPALRPAPARALAAHVRAAVGQAAQARPAPPLPPRRAPLPPPALQMRRAPAPAGRPGVIQRYPQPIPGGKSGGIQLSEPDWQIYRRDEAGTLPVVQAFRGGFVTGQQTYWFLFGPDDQVIATGKGDSFSRSPYDHSRQGRYVLRATAGQSDGSYWYTDLVYLIEPAGAHAGTLRAGYIGSHWTSTDYDLAILSGGLKPSSRDVQFGEGIYIYYQDWERGWMAGFSVVQDLQSDGNIREWQVYATSDLVSIDSTYVTGQWTDCPWATSSLQETFLNDYDIIVKTDGERKVNPRAYGKIRIRQGVMVNILDNREQIQSLQRKYIRG